MENKYECLDLILKEVIRLDIKPNFSQLARDYSCDYRTAKKRYYQQVNIENGLSVESKKNTSKLDNFTQIIDSKLQISGITVKAIYAFLKDTTDYSGGYGILKRYVKDKKINLPKRASIRIFHEPGKSAQVDWKEDFKLLNKNGQEFSFNIFLFTLPNSEMKFLRLTLDKKQDTVIDSLVNSLIYIGGVPKNIWFDNMSTVADVAKTNTKDRVNIKIKQFAHDMGFNPILCRVRRPQSKGTVEALAKFVDRLLAYNNEFETLEQLEVIVNRFNENINNEVSQAHNMVVNDAFEKEKEYLTPLPNSILLDKYFSNRQTRKVSHESMITYKGIKYSVPTKYINCNLEITLDKDNLCIYDNTNLVTCHQISINNPFNYKKEHLKDIIASDLLKGKNDEYIQKYIEKNLSQYDKLLV